MAKNSDEPPSLGGTWQDAGTAMVKGGIGAIPVVGSIIGEIIGVIIPSQRLNRIEDYLRYLTDRLSHIDQNDLKKKFQNPDYIDLFEEGAAQSLRAISDERKQYIANLVAKGIAGDDKARIESKRFLKVIEQIDDDQIIIMASYLRRYRHNDEWFKKHEVIFAPVGAHLGSSREDLDKSTVYELARTQLLQFGLLRLEFKTPRKGEIPDFDNKTGMIKSSSRDLTPSGRLLLTRIELVEADDF